MISIKPRILVFGIFYFALFSGILFKYGYLPPIAMLIPDVMLLLLLDRMLRGRTGLPFWKKRLNLQVPTNIMWLLLIAGCASSFVNRVSIPLFIWEIRNFFRYIIFFWACILFLKKEDIPKILKTFDIVLYVCLGIGLVQYHLLGDGGDSLGGVFKGNPGLALLGCILIPSTIFRYFYKQISTRRLLVNLFSVFAVTLMGEIKFVYYIFAVATFCSVFFIRRSHRLVTFVITVTVLSVIGAALIVATMGQEYLAGLVSEEELDTYLNSEGSYGFIEGSFNRGTAIRQTTEMFFDNAPAFNTLFGFGLGSASATSIMPSPIFMVYQWTNYWFFSTSYLLIEQGWIGLTLFALFWLSLTVVFYKQRMYPPQWLSLTCLFLCFFMIVFLWYSAAIKSDDAYIVYIYISLPFVLQKARIEEENP